MWADISKDSAKTSKKVSFSVNPSIFVSVSIDRLHVQLRLREGDGLDEQVDVVGRLPAAHGILAGVVSRDRERVIAVHQRELLRVFGGADCNVGRGSEERGARDFAESAGGGNA